MSKVKIRENLIGKNINELKVLKREPDYVSPKGYKDSQWLCSCSCGKKSIIRGTYLRKGKIKSCHNRGGKNFKDLTGKTFGNLEVIKRELDSAKKQVSWIVKCLCGRTEPFSVMGNHLRNGHTTGCRLCHTDKVIKALSKNLIGNKFGKLEVIEKITEENCNKKRRSKWRCVCECGNIKDVLGDNLISGKTISCGCQIGESYIATEIKKYLKKSYVCKIEYKIFKNPKTKMWLPYDIYIPYGENSDLNGFYIEVHGHQHYRFTPFLHKTKEDFEYQKHKDKIKKKFAKKHGKYIEIDIRKSNNVSEIIKRIESIILSFNN